MTTLLPPDISLKALLKLAGPIFVANVAIIGSGTIDTIMGGQLLPPLRWAYPPRFPC